ncbi:MAG: 4-hydroxythreonine-4-phosphate dehydrogenase PdxA [Candidatus Omnitrophica bacterium]|jgi:4-hydroxythreonine-4-phosphate dehydrogenase|nr:4-hydroxythreonine-4-phosphate dehydrogenase PdxA [Candidatus Omnitrophota bacterium]MDD5660419.1 4-hydroxythreonine-4-phosphate dehydrogenase PdxA [Candidatus Omnitrophota bacterium]
MNLKNNPTLKSSKVKVGLTIGDPAGIGPAIALKAFQALKNKVDFIVIGNAFALAKQAKELRIKTISKELISLDNIEKRNFAFGRLNAQGGAASLQYLDKALYLLDKNLIDCLVTCPISKEAINLAGSKFSGHTEYLAEKTGFRNLLMFLFNDKLKFSLVTRHIALKDVSGVLTREKLRNNIEATIKCLKSLFLIKKPKIVVCGLNPHASDNGVIGKEEIKVFIPVLKELRKKYKSAVITGPLPSDIAISAHFKKKFDCAIAVYHDQALIPLKLTDFNSGVNLTFGLSFVRTSPLHGTAFDIASRPALANPNSLIAAIKLAVKCTLNQRKA